ncbi:MAG: YbaN family protein [Bacilli bacterium]
MQFRKVILSFFGFVFLGMGGIGVFLPVWPTTPFVLLSFACFSSTPKIKNYIMKNSFFKEHIENYEKRNGLSTRILIISMVWLWSMLIVSFIFVDYIYIRLLLIIVGISVSLHLLVMTKPKDKNLK